MRAVTTAMLVCCAASAVRAAEPYTELQKARVTPVVEVVRRNRDAVVNIAATQVVTVRDGFWSGPFGDIFDTPFSRRMKTNSVGSGAIIHPAGYVLTNAHVVAQASELKVILSDGTSLPAETVSSLPEEDLAIVRVKVPAGRTLQAVRLGRSADLMVGETVLAIGNPFGLQHTVTQGIISALGRQLDVGENERFNDIVQTDAAINPGNSGGPLLNILGEQIGVNTAIRSEAQNVGFAIPIDRVKILLPDLLSVDQKGRVRLGIRWGGEVLDPATGRVLGVKVAGVEPGSPAQRGRLSAGAVVTAVAGREAQSVADVLVSALEQPVGRPFSVTVQENGQTREIKLAVEELPPPDGAALAFAKFGLRTRELDAQSARQFGLRAGAALMVAEVARGSSAARAGVQPGDLVTQVGRYGVRRNAELGELLERVEQGDRVSLSLVRIRGSSMVRFSVVLQAR